jgi:hypothetical protein
VEKKERPYSRRWTFIKKVVLAALVIGLLAFTAFGCNGGETTEGQKEPTSETETYKPVIDPADFVTGIDNPYLPLTPGTTSIYEGDTGEGLEHIEVTVTNDVKEILGVQCVVVKDTVTIDGEVAEVTYDWFAQDKEGNVWYFGEDSKEYENGEAVSTAGSWEAGVDGAQPGIIMKSQPVVDEVYRQEYYEGEAEDMAEVVSLNESVSVQAGPYTDCLKTREWTPLEPGVTEFKYYAPGIGLVLETAGTSESQRIELVEIRGLNSSS